MKNITWTIMRKEFFRFFKDRGLFFTVVVMPGLMIFLIYTLIGDNMGKQFMEDTSVVTPVYVDNMPAALQPLLDSLPYAVVAQGFNADDVKEQLKDKDNDLLYVAFPLGFADSVEASDGNAASVPNVQIFYNSSSPNSMAAFSTVSALLNEYESSLCAPCNRFDINVDENAEGGTAYNSGNVSDEIGSVFASLLPMLIVMMLFSACMSVAPTSIAGEKERGTIATLLVTPMPRNQLAMGKILSLSTIALLSGMSSFLGIILSLPKMIQGEGNEELSQLADATGGMYAASDYALLLVVILTTVLLLVGIISIVSAWAKSVKAAQTMTLPLMIVVMAVSFTPMLGIGETPAAACLFPFYGSVQSMASVFRHEAALLPFLATVGSNLVYTALAIVALARMFGSEKVMFSK